MTIEERLQKLEQKVDAIIAGDPKDEIRTKVIRLVDDFGKVRAILGAGAGEPSLSMSDKNGNICAMFGVEAESAMLALTNADGKARATLCVTENMPALQLNDTNGTARAALHLCNDAPMLNLYDENRVIRTSTTVADAGIGFEVHDVNGKTCAGLRTIDDKPRMDIIGTTGSVTLGALKDGPALLLADRTPCIRAGIRVSGSTQVSELYDARGNRVWAADQ
ncbi:MAG: hypothetical protein A2283_18845 [Lentisphaerae bacterium RIFOXYA12_FULL_48_11]|nr:MAG: hypothetical protein A2283_18845 [Lentisphaerae bacterium RIFOXYA12_FULL_48_11]